MNTIIRLVLTTVLLCTVACGKPNSGDVEIRPWSLRTPSGGRIECERGTLYVPENRSDPKRVIGIGFLRIKALRATGAPPTVHLPGGPGISFLEKLNANKPKESERIINEGFDDDLAFYRNISDMIFFDQRGYSRLGDMIVYPQRTSPLGEEGSQSRHTKEFIDLANRAVAHYRRKGFDLSAYNIKECAADVNALCKALGYRQVTLVGNSFGGQWAFAVIRLFPGIVARALISSVEPLSCAYDIPSEVYLAMKRQWESVPPNQLPVGISSMEEVVREIRRRLPVKVTIQVRVDPGSAKTETKTLVLGRDDLYLPGLEPKYLLDIYNGHCETWAYNVLKKRAAPEDLALIGPLIDISLGASKERRDKLLSDPAVEVVGRWGFEDYFATEKIWPTTNMDDSFRAESKSEVPVVFVQGEWDVQTPRENLEVVDGYFEKSHTIVVTNGPHAAYVRARREIPQVKWGVEEFLRTGSMENLPRTVTLPVCDVPEGPLKPAVKYYFAR